MVAVPVSAQPNLRSHAVDLGFEQEVIRPHCGQHVLQLTNSSKKRVIFLSLASCRVYR
jgi:hypothetical protein